MTEQQAIQRAEMLHALRAFICQRPGLEPSNYYSDWRDRAGIAAYRQESREITRDRADALALLDYVSRQAIGLTPEYLVSGSGRLFWDAQAKGWDYHTGQYFPTEYRAAAARLLANALWDYWRAGLVGLDRVDGLTLTESVARTAKLAFRSRRVRQYFA